MQVSIQYCGAWNYKPRASSLAADVKEAFPGTTVRLIEGSGGVFEVTVDGDLVFSKLKLGRHAGPDEVVSIIKQNQG